MSHYRTAESPLVEFRDRMLPCRQPVRERPAACAHALRALAVAICSSALTTSPPAHAQQQPGVQAFSTSSADWEGFSEFVRLAQRSLGTARVKPSAVLDYGQLSPNDAVVIIRPLRPLDDSSLSAFLADGGRVALLDDFGKGGGLLHKFGIHRVNPPPDPQKRLRDNPDLAIAVPSVQVVAGAERGRHPMALHVDAVVTNHAQVLRHPDLTPVLEIRDRSGEAGALAVTGVIAKRGRLFALGDPSVFINLMLRYPGNRHLAEGMVNYLAERPAIGDASLADEELESPASLPVGPTEGRLWIVANDFSQTGHYGGEESLADQLRRKLEEAGQAVSAIEEEGMPPLLATFLAAVLALWALSSQFKGNLRWPALSSQTFARIPVLAAQTGLGARAEILSSRKANPILALMELDAALRETIARRLGVNPAGNQSELRDAFSQAGLSNDDALSLATVLTDLRGFGQSLGQGRPRKATENKMQKYHNESMRLLSEIERVGGLS